MQEHVEKPVSKNHKKQVSWKTAFGPIIPAELADREDQDHDSERQRQNNSFQCGFQLQQELGVYSPFIAEVPLHNCISNPNVFVIYFCNYVHLSETPTHEFQGCRALVQKSA